jgi:hypothetical protein
VRVLNPALVGEQRVVHLPERVLTRRRLGRRPPARAAATRRGRDLDSRLSPEVPRSQGSKCERGTPSAAAIRHLQGAPRRLAARGRDGRPGVARSHKCREGATGSCRSDSETREFRKRVSGRCAAQTRKARNPGRPRLLAGNPSAASTKRNVATSSRPAKSLLRRFSSRFATWPLLESGRRKEASRLVRPSSLGLIASAVAGSPVPRGSASWARSPRGRADAAGEGERRRGL